MSCGQYKAIFYFCTSQVVLDNKKKWTIAGEILAARGEKQNDVMDIFQVTTTIFNQVCK